MAGFATVFLKASRPVLLHSRCSISVCWLEKMQKKRLVNILERGKVDGIVKVEP